METSLALNMGEELYQNTNKRAFVGEIVTEDDIIMQSNVSHTSKKAKLSIDVPEPLFLADPNHRIKVMLKPIFANVTKSKNNNGIKNIDAMRLKKYTSCYIHQNQNGDLNKFVSNAIAPVEHLFNDHSFCDPAWYWSKDVEQNVEKIL